MASTQHIDNEFSAHFFADIFRLYPQSSRQYRCTDISDIHYCQLGVLRCLSSSTTGQEFLQFHADHGIANIDPSHFFKTLKSPRRLANITSLNDLLAGPMKQSIPDPYAQCPELDDWDLYAVDGHYHQAACFDKKSISSKGELRAMATGHFFRMNGDGDGRFVRDPKSGRQFFLPGGASRRCARPPRFPRSHSSPSHRHRLAHRDDYHGELH